MILSSPQKPWTHFVETSIHSDHSISNVWLPGKESEKIQIANKSISNTRLSGIRICAYDESSGEITNYKGKNLTIDPVSFHIASGRPERMQDIYNNWNLLKWTSAPTFHNEGLKSRDGRFHLEITINNILFKENAILLNVLLPRTLMDSKQYKNLKEIVDDPSFPEGPLITDMYERDGKTEITYDAEDIKLADIFGPEEKHAFLPTGKKITMKEIK